MIPLEAAIIRTLCYADIFDYPLTADEIWKYLVSDHPVPKQHMLSTLKTMRGVLCSHGWYFLPTKTSIIHKRQSRETASRPKLIQAQRIGAVLSRIPSVLFIGISGGLAMHNAAADDDIDFFIITKSHTVWMTRFMVLCYLTLLGKRRRRNATHLTDVICVNMLLSEDGLSLPKDKQNIYTAHEVIQVIPVVNKHRTYEQFRAANQQWVSRLLPNSGKYQMRKGKRTQHFNFGRAILMVCESIAHRGQLWYMKRHMTNESVSSTMLAFHPKDYTRNVLSAYKKRIATYGVL